MATAAHAQPFTVQLSMESASKYKFGEDVHCTMTITNTDSCDYQLLKDDTPLEGLCSDMFHITVGDKRLEYDGDIVKRAPPTEEDCVLIKAGGTLSATVDLSHVHGIDTEGEHTVQLKTSLRFHPNRSPGFLDFTQEVKSDILKFEIIPDADRSKAKLTKGQEARENEKLQAKAEPAFILQTEVGKIALYLEGDYPKHQEDGGQYQEAQTIEAYKCAYEAVAKSLLSVSCKLVWQTRDRAKVVTDWFGENHQNEAYRVYEGVKCGMEKKEFTLLPDMDPRKKRWYAYTHKGTTIIYLCQKYFKVNLTGTDSKMGTIVHELSHALAGTDDVKLEQKCYGQDACLFLAKEHPEMAVRNADNYEYFAELAYDEMPVISDSDRIRYQQRSTEHTEIPSVQTVSNLALGKEDRVVFEDQPDMTLKKSKKLQRLMHFGRERLRSGIQSVLRPWPTLSRAWNLLAQQVLVSPNPNILMLQPPGHGLEADSSK